MESARCGIVAGTRVSATCSLSAKNVRVVFAQAIEQVVQDGEGPAAADVLGGADAVEAEVDLEVVVHEEGQRLLAQEGAVGDHLVSHVKMGGTGRFDVGDGSSDERELEQRLPPDEQHVHVGLERAQEQIRRRAQGVPVHAPRLLVVLIAVAAAQVAARGQDDVNPADRLGNGHVRLSSSRRR